MANNGKLHVMVLTLAGDNVFRKYEAASFEEVKELHLKHRNHPIGLFTAPDGGGEMWTYWPDLAASDAFEDHKARRKARKAVH